jgi:4-alpha-glucanotransferase
LIRIDHFRGFEAYWEIPAQSKTAMDGRWVKVDGEALFDALLAAFHDLPLVAEDLGIITPEVEALREKYSLPGMKILQFAFDGGADNPYLPENYQTNHVVYTGTHDNDTTLGWYEALPVETRVRVDAYLGEKIVMPWSLIECALASSAQLAMFPMQDLLGLGGAHRMNTPGVEGGNWRWRFTWDQVPADAGARLRALVQEHQRI